HLQPGTPTRRVCSGYSERRFSSVATDVQPHSRPHLKRRLLPALRTRNRTRRQLYRNTAAHISNTCWQPPNQGRREERLLLRQSRDEACHSALCLPSSSSAKAQFAYAVDEIHNRPESQ